MRTMDNSEPGRQMNERGIALLRSELELNVGNVKGRMKGVRKKKLRKMQRSKKMMKDVKENDKSIKENDEKGQG